MKSMVVVASVAILSMGGLTNRSSALAVTDRATIVDDADSGWTWNQMTSLEDIGLAKGSGHAGGPGSYGVYTFSGTGVDIYVMRGSSVSVDGHVHRIGKLKISIDGHEKADVSLTATATDYNVSAFNVTGLPSKLHVLQIEPESGWAVVDYIRVSADGSPDANPSVEVPMAEPGILFAGKNMELVAVNDVEARSNVTGFNDGITPELQIAQLPVDWGLANIYAHSGNTALRYSGNAIAGPAYCYMYAFAVRIPVSSNTWLSYWILPQQDNGRYVAVDLHCTDGTALSATAAVDDGGIPVAPSSGHGGAIPLYAWTNSRCHIGEWLGGKTIDKIWIGFSRPIAGGQYRGYIDDLIIANERPTAK